jgi:glycosyltransferase involved in cell wall biosynthesis
MKLLIITQKVDKHDPVLGFFHRWLEEFAKRCELVTVICLEQGDFNLPVNVRVLSLGKEAGQSRLKYLINFYKYIWWERNNYETVLVHMNQEYVLLAGWLWRIWGKHVWLWRNHKIGSWLTVVAVWLAHRVFCTSPQSFTARFNKTKLMPVGIDTNFFSPDVSAASVPRSILMLGRIAPVKHVEVFIDALHILNAQGINFTATIAGGARLEDRAYEAMLRDKLAQYQLTERVTLLGPVTQDGARKLYAEHQVYINLTPAGSMDKTIFEAMAMGAMPLVYNQDLRNILGTKLVVEKLKGDEIAKKINLAFNHASMPELRTWVGQEHGISTLISRLM